MGVLKKGGSYWIDYRVNGRRKREKIGPSKRLAENVLAKRRIEIAEGRFLDRKQVPRVQLKDFVGEYLEYSKANKRNYSREVYLVRKLLGEFGKKQLGEISSWQIERYKAERKQKVSNATVNRELTLLKHMFTKAIEWGKATSNPVKAVRCLRETNARVRFLTDHEEERILAECPGNLRVLVLAALHTGFRRGELLSLRWTDVDFPNGLVTVQAAYAKNGARRSVPMSQTQRSVLIELKRGQPEDGHVFLSARGGPYAAPHRAFASAVKRAKLRDFRFHDLRHTFASRLVMGGVDLRTVQDLLGHKTMAMTRRSTATFPRNIGARR